jgi:hypothetical protein
MRDLIRIIETHIRNGDRSASIGDMAAELGRERRAIRRWCQAGLPSIKVGATRWICWAELKRWIEAKSAPATPARPPRISKKARAILKRMGMVTE